MTPPTRRIVGQRLVKAWLTAPTKAREAIGRLLCDGFADGDLEELVKAVHRPWLQHSGAGDIVTKIDDPELTLGVVRSLTLNDSSIFKIYHPLKPAIEQVRLRALKLVSELILEATDEATCTARSSILSNFQPHAELATIALELARNENLPLEVRLRAYVLTPSPLDADGEAFVQHAITTQPVSSYEAGALLKRFRDPQQYLRDAFGSDVLSDERKLSLVPSVANVVSDATKRQAFIAEIRDMFDQNQVEFLAALDSAAAFEGDQAGFERLVAHVGRNSIGDVGMTISLLGNYRNAQLAELAAQHARDRFTEPEDIARLSKNAVIGMLHRMEVKDGFTGLVHRAQPHPGIAHWTELIEDWCHTANLTALQHTTVLTAASRLGSEEARAQLERVVEGIEDPNDPKWNDGHSLGATVAHAVSELRRRKPLLDKDLVDRLIRADQINLLMSGVKAMTRTVTATPWSDSWRRIEKVPSGRRRTNLRTPSNFSP